MADRINAFKVNCVGGMNTNRDVLSQGEDTPGTATQLINYEPAITGGYRRLSGFNNSYGTVPGVGKVLGVEVVEGINDSVLACRKSLEGTEYFFYWDATAGDWVEITTPGTITMVGVNKVRFTTYNWFSKKTILTDGVTLLLFIMAQHIHRLHTLTPLLLLSMLLLLATTCF